jgi:hypothetical protein
MIAAIIGSALLGLSLGLRYRVGALIVAIAFLIFLIALTGLMFSVGLLSIASTMALSLVAVQIGYLAGSLWSGLTEPSSEPSVIASHSYDAATGKLMRSSSVIVFRSEANGPIAATGKPRSRRL